jgi:hypothetical protein
MAVGNADIRLLIVEQLRYFESEEQRTEFCSFLVEPQHAEQHWAYGDESHACVVVAKNQHEQIVYCRTGFGPAFPWSLQPLGTADLGMDGQWNAYLYECFISSRMWSGQPPSNFELKGPGERAET